MMRWTQGLMIGGFLAFIMGMGLMYGEPVPEPAIVQEQSGGAPIAPDGHQRINQASSGSLDGQEQAALREVLGTVQRTHDLTFVLHDRYPLPVLAHIGAASSTHAAAARTVMDQYDIEDRTGTVPQEVQDRYDELTVDAVNETTALRSAARAQEHLIARAADGLNRTDDTDAELVHRSLRAAGAHQLHALVRRLAMRGVGYEPSVLDEDRYRQLVPQQ